MFLWWRRAHNSCWTRQRCVLVETSNRKHKQWSNRFAATPSKDDQHQIQRVSHLNIIKLLASHGAQIDRQDVRDKTPHKHAQAATESPEASNPSFNRVATVYLLKKLEMAWGTVLELRKHRQPAIFGGLGSKCHATEGLCIRIRIQQTPWHTNKKYHFHNKPMLQLDAKNNSAQKKTLASLSETRAKPKNSQHKSIAVLHVKSFCRLHRHRKMYSHL